MVPEVAVGAVVIVSGPRVLLVRRGKAPLEGVWSLPGGKLEGGETIARGVEREVLEETGIRVVTGSLVDIVEIVQEGFHYVVHDHLCTPVDPAAMPRAGGDALDARYVAPGELGALGVTEAVTKVVLHALQMRQACLEDE